MPRVLITGPVESLGEYADAARSSGWEPVEFPLVRVEALDVDVGELARQVFDALCVTSSNALPFVERLLVARPAWRALACFVVGAKSVERARALGLDPRHAVAMDADELAERLFAANPRPRRVLWPRGSAGSELALTLRARGIEVVDPIVYATRRASIGVPAPRCDAIFFASPSAVRAWSARGGRVTADELGAADEAGPEPDSSSVRAAEAERGAHATPDHVPHTAITIGRTTFDALVAETGPSFRDILVLPEPTSAALAFVLAHLDPTTP